MKKICTQCNEEKEFTEFYTKKGRKSQASFCKNCFNQMCMKRWQQIKIKAIIYKGNKCNDCTLEYPKYPSCIFDFHHLDSNYKEFGWGKLRLKSWNKIIKEIDKCVLLCSNCHRIRHFNLLL